jgi:hypothetical protein
MENATRWLVAVAAICVFAGCESFGAPKRIGGVTDLEVREITPIIRLQTKAPIVSFDAVMDPTNSTTGQIIRGRVIGVWTKNKRLFTLQKKKSNWVIVEDYAFPPPSSQTWQPTVTVH